MSIEISHVTRTFGRFTALWDISLHVPGGQIMALLGPSGSGKTTLLRIIAGLDDPDPDCDGQIRFEGQDVSSLGVDQRNVGFVFQHYALFRHLTVFENVAFGLRVQPRRQRLPEPWLSSQVGRLLALVQLESLAARFPHQLSGGQRQRVALARALAVKPRVLLLDEPFGALDARVRAELRRWLRDLHDEISLTTVFVTHDQEEALEVADRVVVMNEGRIEQVGTPDEVFHSPASPFVMEFLGQVNAFRGMVKDGRVNVGGWKVEVGPEGPSAGEALVYVRPYDWELYTTPPTEPALCGVIRRVRAAGPIARVEIRPASAAPFTVEVAHARWQALGLREGVEVHLSARSARVFPA